MVSATTVKKKYVVSLYSPLGGQGSSFIATQLVHQLAKSGPSCLVDLNLDFSTTLQFLNVDPTVAFRESALGSGESALLSSFAAKVEEKYFAVAAPLLGYGQFAEEAKEATKELFDQCRAEFDFTVMDVPHPLHVELTQQTLALSDLILVICESTEHSANACIKLKQIFVDAKLGIDTRKILFLFNRAPSRSKRRLIVRTLQGFTFIGTFEIVRIFLPQASTDSGFLGLFAIVLIWIFLPSRIKDYSKKALAVLEREKINVFHKLPEDSKSCLAVINQGKFLDEKTALGRALIELGEKLKTRLSNSP